MDDRNEHQNLELMAPSNVLELVLNLAQKRTRKQPLGLEVREAERLSIEAALEQVDNLLMDHWEELDAIPRPRRGEHAGPREFIAHPGRGGSRPVAGRSLWWLRSRIPVEQSPSEAILLVVDLAEQGLPKNTRKRQSVTETLSWSRQFVSRYGKTLDECFGSR